ncbi:MAG: 6,7-dimethyl-8-ribityllumazine synthase [Candidatus Eisenbacteria bacterium]
MSVREMMPAPDASGANFCVLAARWNEADVRRMVDAALEALRNQGASEASLELRWVSGSYELPVAAKWAAESGRFDAVLAFGVVLRGETEHFRLVADAASEGLMRVMLDTGVPVLNGVLAAYDRAQVEARSGGKLGNIGKEVALAAALMVQHRRQAEVQ